MRNIDDIDNSKYASRKNRRYIFQYTHDSLKRVITLVALPLQLKRSSTSLRGIGNKRRPTRNRKIMLKFQIGFVDLYPNCQKLSYIAYLSFYVGISSSISLMTPSTGIKSNVAILTIITKSVWQLAGIIKLIIGKWAMICMQ